ncbi:MAG: oligosaccharide flippase family protein, partial [Acidaminobacteraceae bacterium]
MENKSIVKNSIILASAGISVKFLGFLFKVPLTRMIGAEGFGLYSYPYLIYTALLALSTFGIPVVVSKLIAEKVALHRYSEAHRIFKITLLLMTLVGIISSSVLYFLSDYLAGNIWPRDALI